MSFVNVNNSKLYYEIHGQGKPLVLVAGLSCPSRVWHFILDGLKDRFKVIIFDNRGVGHSEVSSEPYTIDLLANDTIALMDQLGIEKAHLLGHSMGGTIAQTIAFKSPERVNRLILCNSLMKVDNFNRWQSLFLLFLQKVGMNSQRLTKKILPYRLFSKQFRQNQVHVSELMDHFIHQETPQSQIGSERQLKALLAFDSSKWVNQIKAPTLVIRSEQDKLCPRDPLQLAHHIPYAQLYTFLACGHVPMVESPHLFNEVVFDFLCREK